MLLLFGKWRYLLYFFIFVLFSILLFVQKFIISQTMWIIGIVSFLFVVSNTLFKDMNINEGNKRLIHELLAVIGISAILYLPCHWIYNNFINPSLVVINNNSETKMVETIPEQYTVPELDMTVTPEEIKKEVENPNEPKFSPTITTEKINGIFLNTQFNSDNIKNETDKIQLMQELVNTDIQNRIGTKLSADCDELNNNKEYTNLIERINSQQIGANTNDYTNVIALRERAYSFGKTRALCLNIARDYYQLGKLYVKEDIRQEAFDCYVKAIDYYNESFSLMENNNGYMYDEYDIAYTVSQIYHSIGDIQYLDNEIRKSAYCMARAYCGISCLRDNGKMFSYYYCGMLDHKLAILGDGDESIYLLDAENCYNEALEHSPKNITKKYLYTFLSQIYSELISYINHFGKQEMMLSINEYQQKQEMMLKNVQDLDKILPSKQN